MIFIGTVNIANIVAPDIWSGSPIAEKIVSNSSDVNTRGEDTKDSSIESTKTSK
jgi:hypothetical protein